MAADPNERKESRSTSVKELFLAAADLPVSERAAYLDRACANDAALRGRVEALLRAHDEPGSFPAGALGPLVATLDSRPGAAVEPGETSAPDDGDEPVGSSIGPYKLLQKLGEGGMGTVYMAEQSQPVRRMVALKIIRAGLDSRQVVARFEAERQALALMDHPNIARVLDVGTTGPESGHPGRPYFAMELVKGIPITRFCDEQHLTPRERLKLFVPVCQAVQHAHQKGIIHRDLKPSNVLVALYDDHPVPKVIDFGVAKATSQKLTDRTMFTEFGSVVGTLEYMSPEQAKLNALDVDTRSDIYALGVLLYELLTGTTPLERKRLKDSALDELLRLIREEEPPLPSTRLGQSKESLPAVAAQRQTEPARLAKIVRGDLDWIVMKALEKDRSRRYDTASSMAHDIERYLNQQPVEACPPSTAYRLRKFLRRNRGPVLAAALLLLALIGGIAGTSWGLVAASQALRGEQQQRDIAERAATDKERERAAAANERDQKEQARAAAEKALYFNRVSLALQYWQGNNFAQSRRMLDLCPPAGRGWEWRYLDRIHHADLATLPGNGQFTTTLSLSKDGTRLAAFSPYGEAGVTSWDLSAKKILAEIKAGAGQRRFTCAALSPDGRTVALGEQSGAVALWNAETGKLDREFAKLPHSISALSFSPDGRWLAAGRADGRNGEMLLPWLEPPRNEDLIVWDLSTGKEVFHPKGYGFVAQFSPSGSRLLTLKKNSGFRAVPAMAETSAALFDTSTWTEVAAGKLGSANSFAFSANGKWLALGGLDRIENVSFVRIVNQATGDQSVVITPNVSGANFDVALSPDGSALAITQGLGFGEIEIWDVKKRQRTLMLRGHLDSVNSLQFSASGRLLSCSWDNTIKIWDPAVVPELRSVALPITPDANPALLTSHGNLLAFSESGTVNLVTGPHTSISLIDLEIARGSTQAEGNMMRAVSRALFKSVTDSPDRSLEGNENGTVAIAATADGKRLVSGGRLGDVKSWDLATQEALCSYRGHDGTITAIAITDDGRWAASTQEPKEITRARFGTGALPAAAVPVAVKVWNAETGRERFSLPGHANRVYQLAFSRDGRLLASSGPDAVKIWDMATGNLLRELNHKEMQSGASDALHFSPDGDLLATAGQAVQLWDVTSGHSTALLQGHRGRLQLAFSPDQSRLATAAGRQVKLWDVKTGQEALTLPFAQLHPDERATNVAALAWSADGQRLRAALRDGSVVEWDATPKEAR